MDGQQLYQDAECNSAGNIVAFARSADNIGMALLRVYQRISYVQKAGYNSGQKYNYAGEEHMIQAIRPALVDEGVIHYPAAIENIHVTETPRTVNGEIKGASTHIVALFTFAFLHAPSGTSIRIQVLGEGTDSLDKAAYKAMTGALKYGLRQPLLMQCGNDPDDVHEQKDAEAAADRLVKEARFRLWEVPRLGGADLQMLGNWLRVKDGNTTRGAWLRSLDRELYERLTAAATARKAELEQPATTVPIPPPEEKVEAAQDMPTDKPPADDPPTAASTVAPPGYDDELVAQARTNLNAIPGFDAALLRGLKSWLHEQASPDEPSRADLLHQAEPRLFDSLKAAMRARAAELGLIKGEPTPSLSPEEETERALAADSQAKAQQHPLVLAAQAWGQKLRDTGDPELVRQAWSWLTEHGEPTSHFDQLGKAGHVDARNAVQRACHVAAARLQIPLPTKRVPRR